MTVSDNDQQLREPKLEDYGLNSSTYSEYLVKLKVLKNQKDTLKQSAERLKPGWLLKCIAVAIFVVTTYALIKALMDVNRNFAWLYVVVFLVAFNTILGEGVLIANLFSFGKYRKTNKTILKTEKRIDIIEQQAITRLAPFEKATKQYYEQQIENTYRTTLYRKRSGTEQFDRALQGFVTDMLEADEINKIMFGEKIQLDSYADYLLKRMFARPKQEKDVIKKTSEFRQIADKQPALDTDLTQTPPEERYRTPQKVDWEELNMKRRKTGLKGEEIVVELQRSYLNSVGRSDLADKVSHVSVERGDGLGYDVLSYFPDGGEKYIEVKSTTGSLGSDFYISKGELAFLANNTETAFIYRVSLGNPEVSNSSPKLEVKSADAILHTSQLIPETYIVRCG